ncbi:MAG TPA: exo-alpha-sialidase [Verrucomicrobiae bacterium]|nr:exo-alpha-sialidase [Verrucomicrobiae bacterium]
MKLLRATFFLALLCTAVFADEPAMEGELIFPPEHWHAHASCIIEAPNGDLLVCWFQGSGERTADDVKIEGARLRKGEKTWTKRFVMADTPEYPDTNCSMFVDPEGRLWLIWPTILANTWESALLKVWISDDWQKDAAPRWTSKDVLHIKPPAAFGSAVGEWLNGLEKHPILNSVDEDGRRGRAWLAHMRSYSTNKLNQRLGWMTRAHPFVLGGKRLIVPLYSDGFSFSLMAITDDWGKSWHTSTPLLGLGNIQPSIVQRKDGSLYTLMRDNGPPPKRLHQSSSKDRGETWEPVTDSELSNPGSGAEIIRLQNGHWLLISNDTERERNRLAVQISDDDGKSWKWKRYVEKSEHTYDRFHYPSVMQARDGWIHATYSHHMGGPDLPKDVDGDPAAKSIKHVRFNEAWITKAASSASAFPLRNDDVVAFVGGADMAAAQHTGHLESLLAAKFPGARFRNLAWEGDTVYRQPRDLNFPSLSTQVRSAGATVIVVQFGKMESVDAADKLENFQAAYGKLLDELSQITPRIVLVTPAPIARSTNLRAYVDAIAQLARERGLQLANITSAIENSREPATDDGFQLTPLGQALMATAIANELSLQVNAGGCRDRRGIWENPAYEQLRQAVIAKNKLWFNYSRPQNWAFLGGDRTEQPSSRDHRDPKIRWFPEEMKQFTSLISEAETQIESAAHAVH